jgi:tRNA 2-thiouridine synthesizing protein E
MMNNTPALDKEGFLLDLRLWDRDLATKIAESEGIKLSNEHFVILHLARDFYQDFDISPEMRPLVKWVKKHLGKDKGNSIYLMSLFPNSPAKLVSKIAGLPKPLNCI